MAKPKLFISGMALSSYHKSCVKKLILVQGLENEIGDVILRLQEKLLLYVYMLGCAYMGAGAQVCFTVSFKFLVSIAPDLDLVTGLGFWGGHF